MNLLSLLGLEGLAARWRANVIEGAIAVRRMELVGLEWAAQEAPVDLHGGAGHCGGRLDGDCTDHAVAGHSGSILGHT